MTSSLKLLTESDLTILEEIVECPRCLSSNNICKSHSEVVKTILIKNAKHEIDEEDLDEFVYEFHERVLGIEPEQNERPEWDWIRRK